MIIFDIETKPIDGARLRQILPKFDPGKHEFATEEEYWAECESKAALAAHTCEIVAIGYRNTMGAEALDTILEFNETQLVMRFWDHYHRIRQKKRRMIGFNSHAFDVPVIMRRTWILGQKVPDGVVGWNGYLSADFLDLMRVWQCGDFRHYISLDTLAKTLGIKGKPDDCTGESFYKLLMDTETRDRALRYLSNDLLIPHEIAIRLGVA